MMSTPTKPTATADQRRMPTCSPKIGIESIVFVRDATPARAPRAAASAIA